MSVCLLVWTTVSGPDSVLNRDLWRRRRDSGCHFCLLKVVEPDEKTASVSERGASMAGCPPCPSGGPHMKELLPFTSLKGTLATSNGHLYKVVQHGSMVLPSKPPVTYTPVSILSSHSSFHTLCVPLFPLCTLQIPCISLLIIQHGLLMNSQE
jgi:hypothetical protein